VGATFLGRRRRLRGGGGRWPLTVVIALAGAVAALNGQTTISSRARQLHDRAIVIDTHVDTTQRLIFEPSFQLASRHRDGSIDVPRVRDGGLDAIFFSIWMDGSITGPPAVAAALKQIEAVHDAVSRQPWDLSLAMTAADIRRAAAAHKIAVLMGVEGGHMLNEDLDVLRDFAARGVRYLTLTHSRNTPWADSSGDTAVHDGLAPFGQDVVRELNRLGVMVDVSHVSDATFVDVLEVTRAPVLASHSSVRAIANSPRNMTDEMLRALAKNGGVVMINYAASFLSEEFRVAYGNSDWQTRIQASNKACGADEACAILAGQRLNHDAMRTGRLPMVSWQRIVDHIDHAVRVAGIDHVGLGSDFDGATMPLGMEDASKLPLITDALLRKGYSDRDVLKILGGNLLRVMEQVERVASTR
jgi:membrane dipeptidase